MMVEGYKETEIGVIPDDWEVSELRDIGKVSMCKRIMKNETTDYGKIPFYKIGTFGKEADAYISEEVYEEYKNKYSFPKKGDILISASGTIGRLVVYNGEPAYFQDSNIVWIDNQEDKLLNSLLFYIYKTVKWHTDGNTIARLYNENLRRIKIPLPPLKEQEKIADILSTADEKIDAIEEQIQKTETLKKGLLQKLLSEGIGHSEFKDSELGKIPESWEVVELATITTILLSNVDKKSKEDEQDVKLCNYMDVYNNQYITNNLDYMEATAKDNQIEKFQLKINDVIITKDSETKDDIAIPAVVKETFENLICGYHLAALRPKENILYGVYLMKVIQSVNVHKHFEKLANGITRFGLTSSAINQALIPLPSLEEQKQIADILSTADEKVEVLRAKKEKYETLKKGLLQKLLSGEVRV